MLRRGQIAIRYCRRFAVQACAAATLAVSAAGSAAIAQGAQGVTVTNEFDAKAAERERRKRAPLAIDAGDLAPSPASRGGRFLLRRVRVVGAHAIPREELSAAYREALSRRVNSADLARITTAITATYRAHGYALSRAFIPPQDVENGEVTVQVVEGRIAEVAVEGPGSDWAFARAMLEPITREAPARLVTIERHMLLLNDVPGVEITDSTLKELGTGTGRFRLTVAAKYKRAVVSLDVDNRGSAQLGPWQNYSTVAFNSTLRRGDALVINGSTIVNEPRQLGYFAAIYDAPVGANGARAGARVALSQGHPAGYQRTIETNTESFDASLYASIAAWRTRASSARLTAATGIRDVEEQTLYGISYLDHIRTVSLSADLQAQDPLGGANFVSVQARQGIAGLGATASLDADASRYWASPDFSKLSFNAMRLQPLAGRFSLLLAGAGQLSSGPLLRSEAFYYGGSVFGRAFAPGAFWGDAGLAGLAELRFDQDLNVAALKSMQVYAFADSAVLWNRGFDSFSASSFGAGVRFQCENDLRLGLEVAAPLNEPVGSDAGTRVYLSVSRTFSFIASAPREFIATRWGSRSD